MIPGDTKSQMRPALRNGEIDYIETFNTDLLPILDAEPDVTAEVRDPLGYQT